MTLSEQVFEFECDISDAEFALGEKERIRKLETLEDVKEYYLYERRWIDSESLVDLLFDFLIGLK